MEFSTLKQLQKYTEKHGRFEDGECVKILEDNQVYMYKNSNWEPIDVKSKVAMNLYDINKQIFSQLKPYGEEEWKDAVERINMWRITSHYKYHMMLCKDLSYYTILHKERMASDFDTFGNAIRECLSSCFEVVDIDCSDIDKIEIWIKDADEAYVMYIFGYDDGVVSYGGQ